MRDSVGRRIDSSAAVNSFAGSLGGVQSKAEPDRSRERRAFCKASGKLRPIAIASPTLFMVVVRVVSARGNFSKANRGALTTT